MKLAHKKSEVRHIVAEWRRSGSLVALVPTMGALHDGHVSLIRKACQHADFVVVSVFVNPTQFGPNEDFRQYPRTLNKDVEICRKEGVSLVFAPDMEEMYGPGGPEDHFISFRITEMNTYLCGASRIGHFEGVLQVVNKLFHIVQPDVAVFGQKDIQQWFIIRQMVEEQDHPVKILMSPTIREPDGLACSSRNVRLTQSDRAKAPMLFEVLHRISDVLSDGVKQAEPVWSGTETVEQAEPVHIDDTLLSAEKRRLEENGFNIDYLSIVSVPELKPVDVIEAGRLYILAVAAWLGNTRLIDNILLNTSKMPDYDA